jgi:hypothetical protein
MRANAVLIAILTAVLSVAASSAFAQSPEIGRGRALYEIRCGLCHDRSVHQRNARAAKSFAEIRAAVARWDRELGAAWRGDEVDAVTRYLNDRYYHYPCPRSVCGSERVRAPVPAVPRPARVNSGSRLAQG